jgi:hypothetical protein
VQLCVAAEEADAVAAPVDVVAVLEDVVVEQAGAVVGAWAAEAWAVVPVSVVEQDGSAASGVMSKVADFHSADCSEYRAVLAGRMGDSHFPGEYLA